MPQLLAVEWDNAEARVAVAGSRGDRIVVEHALAVPLAPRQPDAERTEANVGEQIAAALSARGISRGDTLVAVGRARIEVRQFSVPPAPDDELPDLVRFQAMREFNELDENWLLDFVPMDAAAGAPRNVLAAAIKPENVAQIEQACHKAGLKPRRLILRPCAAASLCDRAQPAERAKLRLLVDLLSDEADLTVMADGKVVFLRTMRLADDPLSGTEQAAVLLGEIRRTIAAAQNQLGGRRVESIVLCGRGDRHDALARLMQETLGTPTTLFDPFVGLNLSHELQEAPPELPGRFAPLLGMLLSELEHTPHAIDFLHPRRRPPPPSRRKMYIAAGVAAGVLLLGYFVYTQIERNWLEDEIAALESQSKSLDDDVARADKLEKKVKMIEKWTAGDMPWLEELRKLSKRCPPAKEMMLTQMTVLPSGTGGEIQLSGLAASTSTIEEMEKSLYDKSHGVVPKGSSLTPKAGYRRQFKESVSVEPEKR
jgi:Tfp pilus assembly PilM family ATPase/Tfp pilus assembly protein PilN